MTLDIRALIFDLDGVIADTAEFQYQSWKRLADEEGLTFTREDNHALRGVARRESLDLLLKGRAIDDATAAAWMARKNAYYLELLADLSRAYLLPGIDRLLAQARAADLMLAVASASRNARHVLERLGISGFFAAIADGDSVTRTKPHPDIFLWAAGRIATSPRHALVLEDSEAGVAAARLAGFWTLGLGDAPVTAAHICLSDLRDTDLPLLLHLLTQQARA